MKTFNVIGWEEEAEKLNIPKKESKIIFDIVSVYGFDSGYQSLVRKLKNFFKEDIRSEHYLMLGFIIGGYQTAGKVSENFNKQILWQKLN